MSYGARTLEEFDAIWPKAMPPESRERGKAFRPRPSDVIISPHAKCGTTWLQHIAHGLRSRGDMEFDEITAVTPWLEVAWIVGWDLDGPQPAEPRLFKSHLNWHDVPKGGRYLVSFRNPYAVAVSYYRFFENWLFAAGAIDMEDFIRHAWLELDHTKAGYFHHLVSWWEQRRRDDVLLLCYEDMEADLAATVAAIAGFMGLEPDEDGLATVVRQSSREFMLEHRAHFDDRYMRRLLAERAGLPFDGDSHKVTAGAGRDPRYRLSPALREGIDAVWRERIGEPFGLRDYPALREAVGRLPSRAAPAPLGPRR